MKPVLPKIAIVGRPNVGKSSLFNAIIRKRKAIVDAVPGITRDRIYEKVFLKEQYPVYFIDTGGISKRESHLFVEEITQSSRASIEEADIVLFVTDVQNINQDDMEIAEHLRKNAAEKTILVVNKVDNEKRELEAYEFHSLGFEKMVFVSAAHSQGIDDLTDKIVESIEIRNIPIELDKPEEEKIRLSLLGRPNVGKSSFLNKALRNERSIVSSIPGTTMDVVEEDFDFHGRTIALMDTAGIRRKARIKEKVEYVSIKRSIWAIRNSDVVLLLIDSLEGITDQDKKLAGLALENYRGLIVGVNKWDLVQREEIDEKEYLERIRLMLRVAGYVPVIPISVANNYNLQKFLKKAVVLHDNFTREISTGDLTNFLRRIIQEKPLYSKKGEFKIFYATQTGIKPPEFQIFVNHPELVPPSYLRFLKNAIREEFGYEGIPLKVLIKSRRKRSPK